jgi:hypothetical protein
MTMLEFQLVYWWAANRIRTIRDRRDHHADRGLVALEWMAIAAVAIAAAIIIGIVMYNKGKAKANSTNLQ